MKKILIAVDDTKGTKNAVSTFANVCKCINPESVILLYVEQFEGRTLMTEMLPVSELSTLKEVLEGTDYKEALDRKAAAVIDYYRSYLEKTNLKSQIKPLVKLGNPSEEILDTAKEEEADMIIVGSRGKRVSHLFMGSVSREVANLAPVPVLVVK
ncbi:MAG: universal stress protein [Nitrospirae bacterium]|nr:universal stress protein [Nitrospirota bacterium]